MALYRYEATDVDELAFLKGDTILVYDQSGAWWEGECRGRYGRFPRGYVAPLQGS